MNEELRKMLVDKNARITCGNRWLCAEENTRGDVEFSVYERKPYAKRTTVFYEGNSFASALDYLGRDE